VTWNRGKARVEELLRDGELATVPPSETLARRLIDESVRHLASANAIADTDATGCYQLAYDAARKACSALLAEQGLRATTRGGHVAVQDTVREQFGGSRGMKAFDALSGMRRRRAASEYPDSTSPTISSDDANDAITASQAILDAAQQILDSNRLDPFQPD
jgi:hypothetical protein